MQKEQATVEQRYRASEDSHDFACTGHRRADSPRLGSLRISRSVQVTPLSKGLLLSMGEAKFIVVLMEAVIRHCLSDSLVSQPSSWEAGWRQRPLGLAFARTQGRGPGILPASSLLFLFLYNSTHF